MQSDDQQSMKRKVIIMKKISRFLCFVLVAISMLSCLAFSSSAKTSYKLSTLYSNYTNVTLTDKKKDAYIYVHNSDNVYGKKAYNYHYVKLTNSSGKWLWEGKMGSNSNYQEMYLGNDHSAYRVYVRAAYGTGGRVAVTVKSNCKIS